MAKLTKKVLGFGRGKVADVVFAKFRSETIARGYQPNVRNPRTDAQVVNRMRFGEAADLAQGLFKAVNKGFARATSGTNLSPRNLFTREVLKGNTITASLPDTITVDFSKIKVAQGSLSQPAVASPTFDDPLTVEVRYTPTVETDSDDTYFVVAVYNRDDNKAIVRAFKEADIVNHTVTVTVPSMWNGVKVHVYAWLSYQGDDQPGEGLFKGDVCDSVYAGQGNIS